MARAAAASPPKPRGTNPLEQTFAAVLGGGEAEEVFLWPCNVPAWQAWCALQTQWRTGMGGATGLDYVAVIQYLRAVARLRGDALAEAFEILQGAERAVLELWAEHRELSSGH